MSKSKKERPNCPFIKGSCIGDECFVFEVCDEPAREPKLYIHDFIDRQIEQLIYKTMTYYRIKRKYAIKEIDKIWTKLYARRE